MSFEDIELPEEMDLPDGEINEDNDTETTEDAAKREAKEETSIDIESVKLFNVYSDPNRDPRRHTVSIVYLAHGNFDDAKADDDAKDIGVYSFDDLEEMGLAFDHETILSDVKEHLEKN